MTKHSLPPWTLLPLLGLGLAGCHRSEPAPPVSPTLPRPLAAPPAQTVTTPPPSAPAPRQTMPPSDHIPPGEPGGPDPLKTPPHGLRARLGDGRIAIDWDSSGAESYNLYRGSSPGQEGAVPIKTGINSTPWVDTGLTNGKTYYYQVTGVVGGKESPRSAEFPATPQAASPAPETRLTPAQAITAAQSFCQAVGVPVGLGQSTFQATATFPAGASRFPEIAPSSPLRDTYWQPRWDVRAGRNEIEVSDATGVVTKFFAMDSFDNRPAEKAIPRSQALARAAAIIRATGVTETLGSPQAQEMQMASPPQRATHLWDIIYPRQFQGHPVREQQVTVMLQAETGALQGVGVTFPTPLPAPATPKVSVASAQASATAQLKLAQGPTFIFRRAQLEWVQPGSRFPASESSAPSDILRLVWNCQFTEKNRSYAEVWVDAQTGQIIGGEMASI